MNVTKAFAKGRKRSLHTTTLRFHKTSGEKKDDSTKRSFGVLQIENGKKTGIQNV